MNECKDCVAVLRAGLKGLCRVHELEAENGKLRGALEFIQTLECISSYRPCVCCLKHSEQVTRFVKTACDASHEETKP